MKNGILDVIRSLSAQGASGRLQINTGMTDGALFFDRGELVDARLANLSGFQAVNALVSVPNGNYSFDSTVRPPAQHSITANERVLLKDFFGIEAGNDEPLTAEDDDEVTLVRSEPSVVPEPAAPPVVDPIVAEPALPEPAFTEPQHPVPVQPIPRSTFRPALFFVLLSALIAIAAVALLYRLRKPNPTTTPSVVSTTEVPPAPATVSAVPDLSGNWDVVNTVEQTSYQAYKNMRVGFNVSINQTGKDFTGQGEKISENGRSLPATSRTPIVVRGTIDGDKVEATFSESGAMRKTNGRFVWKLDKTSGGLTGTFVTNAARSSGKSAAKKSH